MSVIVLRAPDSIVACVKHFAGYGAAPGGRDYDSVEISQSDLWNVYLPPLHAHSLYLGYVPRDMDDKWFIYSQGPDALGKLKVHFHRSWTGVKIVEVFVVIDVKGSGAGKIVGVKWDGSGTIGSGRLDAVEAKDLVSSSI